MPICEISEVLRRGSGLLRARHAAVRGNRLNRRREERLQRRPRRDERGYGLCGNRAVMFKEICEVLGIKSRVWNIMGLHTFSEIFVSGKWMILDPDLSELFDGIEFQSKEDKSNYLKVQK